jgi:hypothetical protein
MMTLQPCMNPRNWQRSIAEAIQCFLDNISGDYDQSMIDEKSSNRTFRTSSMSRSASIIDHEHQNHSTNNINYSSIFGRGANTINNSRNSSGLGGINLANISYDETNGANELLQGESRKNQEMTVAEIMAPLKDVFYITDLVVVNKALAGKLSKCGLEGSLIMIRAGKEKLYESSEQIKIG